MLHFIKSWCPCDPFNLLRDPSLDCTNDKPPQRGGAVPFPTLGRVEMACQFPEGLILGQFSRGQLYSSFLFLLSSARSHVDSILKPN